MSDESTVKSKMTQSVGVLVCIPAYNAESTISEAIKRCQKFADLVLVINDGSSDNTEFLAKEAGADVISHKQNRGYGAAIKTGLIEGLKKNAKVTITFDADLQHDENDIPKLVKPIIDDTTDIVIGSRFIQKNDDVKNYRKFGIKLITVLVNLFMNTHISDAESGLRAYSIDSLKELVPVLETEGMGMSSEILLKSSVCKLKILEIPRKEMYPDGVKTSSKNPLKHGLSVVFTIIKLIIENKPLKAFGIPSVIFFAISIISALNVIDFYNTVGRLPLGLTIFTVLLLSTAFFFSLAAMLLYVLSRLATRINFNLRTK
ncbi:MAG: glycosyl transferase [Thaumarchaeota archaeon]|nr:MAG: glycosyl transferase [Nitrososphaerota archaeon]